METLKTIAFFVFSLGFAFGISLYFVAWLDKTRCLESYSNYNVEWGFFSGCRIEWDGKMTPIEIIREIN